jgi:hypothetical protein
VRVRAHPPLALRRERCEFGHQAAFVVEELLGPVAQEPLLELAQVGGGVPHGGHRHLVRAPAVLGLLPVDLLRARPALWGAQDQHRPGGA